MRPYIVKNDLTSILGDKEPTFGAVYVLKENDSDRFYIGATDSTSLAERMRAHHKTGLGTGFVVWDVILVAPQERFRMKTDMVRRAQSSGWDLLNSKTGKPGRLGSPPLRDRAILASGCVDAWLGSLQTAKTRMQYSSVLTQFFWWLRVKKHRVISPEDVLADHQHCLASGDPTQRIQWGTLVEEFIEFRRQEYLKRPHDANRGLGLYSEDLQRLVEPAVGSFFRFNGLPLVGSPRRYPRFSLTGRRLTQEKRTQTVQAPLPIQGSS